jgi:ketosteroid isomerase-like protein
MSRENVEALRRSVEGWNRENFDAWQEAFHPEMEFFSAITRQAEGGEGVWRRRDGARRFWDEWHSLWNLTIELSDFRDLGDTVVGLGAMTTRGHTSGVELESPVAYVGEFEDGLLRRMHAFLDHGAALRAVGLSQE